LSGDEEGEEEEEAEDWWLLDQERFVAHGKNCDLLPYPSIDTRRTAYKRLGETRHDLSGE
jgi:hypothetical protein